jgi:L-ascorbate metabolism protein UlaG (beta-lactamase superfamily)
MTTASFTLAGAHSMKTKPTILGILTPGLLALLVAGPAGAQVSDRIAAERGDIVITPLLHASAQIEYAGTVIHIDPWTVADLSRVKPADLILVTDDPSHHLDPDAIAQLRKPGAPVVLTANAHARFADGTVLANGESGLYAGVQIEAIPAYDMTPGEPYHPYGEANGYLITLGGKRLFFSGVGECVPEIRALENIDVAVMPMNLPVDRMRPIPVAECVKVFKPAVVYVNHYDNPHSRWLENPRVNPPPDSEFTAATFRALAEALEGTGIEFRAAPWYPPYP